MVDKHLCLFTLLPRCIVGLQTTVVQQTSLIRKFVRHPVRNLVVYFPQTNFHFLVHLQFFLTFIFIYSAKFPVALSPMYSFNKHDVREVILTEIFPMFLMRKLILHSILLKV